MIDQRILDAIEESRQQMHRMIDDLFDERLARLQSDTPPTDTTPDEVTLPLRGNANFFKGKRPISVIFPNGDEIPAKTWKGIVYTILADCTADPDRLAKLKDLSCVASGKSRYILLGSPNLLDAPIRVCDGLYMETKYDTETLLNVLMTRLLDVVNYDYSGVKIRCTLSRRRM